MNELIFTFFCAARHLKVPQGIALHLLPYHLYLNPFLKFFDYAKNFFTKKVLCIITDKLKFIGTMYRPFDSPSNTAKTKQKRHPKGCLSLIFVVNFYYINVFCINALQNVGQISLVNTKIDFFFISFKIIIYR